MAEEAPAWRGPGWRGAPLRRQCRECAWISACPGLTQIQLRRLRERMAERCWVMHPVEMGVGPLVTTQQQHPSDDQGPRKPRSWEMSGLYPPRCCCRHYRLREWDRKRGTEGASDVQPQCWRRRAGPGRGRPAGASSSDSPVDGAHRHQGEARSCRSRWRGAWEGNLRSLAERLRGERWMGCDTLPLEQEERAPCVPQTLVAA